MWCSRCLREGSETGAPPLSRNQSAWRKWVQERLRRDVAGEAPSRCLRLFEWCTNADQARAPKGARVVLALAVLVGALSVVPGVFSLYEKNRAAGAVTIAGGLLAIALAAYLFVMARRPVSGISK